jgi:hypothetical protein
VNWFDNNVFIEPFLNNEFLRYALAAGILVAITCAVAGTFVVLRGLAFVGDALAHGVLPGIATALLLGVSGIVGAAVGAVAEGRAALAISQISEIIAVPGALLVGPLPDSAQLSTAYLGAVATAAADAAGAGALLAALTGPEGQARFRAAGFAVG